MLTGALSLMPSRLPDKHQPVISFSRRVVKTPGGFNCSAWGPQWPGVRGAPPAHLLSPLEREGTLPRFWGRLQCDRK